MSKKKKIILLVSMVLVLAVAAVLNITLLTKKGDDSTGTPTGSFFTTSKNDRQEAREYQLAQLNDILKLEGDEYAEARKNALNQKNKLVNIMETELILETLLKAQGYTDVLVTIGSASDNVNVIVGKDDLGREDTVKIYNIITTEVPVGIDFVEILSI